MASKARNSFLASRLQATIRENFSACIYIFDGIVLLNNRNFSYSFSFTLYTFHCRNFNSTTKLNEIK